MNKVILMGRLTRDPEVRYSQGDSTMAVARFTLAVDRRGRRDANGDGTQTADFISCVAFRTNAEFIEKYFRQGMRVLWTSRNLLTARERQRGVMAVFSLHPDHSRTMQSVMVL